jgi:PBP1b-binding outer membrane lipoprotein LpoB
MKRLALITMTAFLALVLSACGERVEKKTETNTVDTTQPAPADSTTTTTTDTTKTNP